MRAHLEVELPLFASSLFHTWKKPLLSLTKNLISTSCRLVRALSIPIRPIPQTSTSFPKQHINFIIYKSLCPLEPVRVFSIRRGIRFVYDQRVQIVSLLLNRGRNVFIIHWIFMHYYLQSLKLVLVLTELTIFGWIYFILFEDIDTYLNV